MHSTDCPCTPCKESRAVAVLASDQWGRVRIPRSMRNPWFSIDDLSEWMNGGYEVPE